MPGRRGVTLPWSRSFGLTSAIISIGTTLLMNFRSDINGVRVIAVIPVLLFHAGTPAVQGGYLGVDVFFVISGSPDLEKC
jgi:hypothetical protein